jgi:hypothetical protein
MVAGQIANSSYQLNQLLLNISCSLEIEDVKTAVVKGRELQARIETLIVTTNDIIRSKSLKNEIHSWLTEVSMLLSRKDALRYEYTLNELRSLNIALIIVLEKGQDLWEVIKWAAG